MEIIDQIINKKAELFDILRKLESIQISKNQKLQELQELENEEKETRRIA